MARSKADEYRDKARECELRPRGARSARSTTNPEKIAEKWRTMAAFEEKFER